MSFIETERLLIRTWMPSDLDAMADIMGDAETMRYIGPGFQHGYTREQTRASLGRMTEIYEREGLGIWPVVLKESGTVIGSCGLQKIPSGDVEVAYILGKEFRGNGYAFEAASAVMESGFRDHGLTEIVAFVHRGNVRSIALINKLGMRFDRIVRVYRADLMRYVKKKRLDS